MSDNSHPIHMQETTFTISKDEILETAEMLGYSNLTDKMVDEILVYISTDDEMSEMIDECKKSAIIEIARENGLKRL